MEIKENNKNYEGRKGQERKNNQEAYDQQWIEKIITGE